MAIEFSVFEIQLYFFSHKRRKPIIFSFTFPPRTSSITSRSSAAVVRPVD
ncbi:hypothetical protein CKA32_000533 [Geitlerinema sp. FC II]|nr:hypothetical protein CKA32_000533 [Geitlerinema sp. FC II]